ncbi:MAG TPA: FAD-dependent oxidoreductase [Myxococcus sp.]|nr:FAD-dependent oxidoreductase [Myxococcus sp.]
MSTPSPLSTPPAGQHAIVYGGSMAGLITAGVLARHFERVTLVERDGFEQGPQQRKGVPQARHLHGLLTRGLNILGELFPGIQEDLKAAGAQVIDMAGDHAWYMAGLWRPRIQSGISFYAQSRPLLEWTVRQRVLALPNVRLLDGREVTGFLTSADKARVTGVQLQAPGGGDAQTLEGELVVDTSGRGSRTPQWLEALGYPRVEETRIHVDVIYGSRLFRPPANFAASWKMLSVSPELPKDRKVGSICTIEDNQWLVTMAGWLGAEPPQDDAGYLEFARSMTQPHFHEALRHAEPLGPVHLHKFSHNQRRHYERMSRFPEVKGQRPPGFELLNRYGDRFQRLAGHDEEAYKTFLRIMHMLESPAAMVSPRLVLKALTARPDAASLARQPEPLLAAQPRAA